MESEDHICTADFCTYIGCSKAALQLYFAVVAVLINAQDISVINSILNILLIVCAWIFQGQQSTQFIFCIKTVYVLQIDVELSLFSRQANRFYGYSKCYAVSVGKCCTYNCCALALRNDHAVLNNSYVLIAAGPGDICTRRIAIVDLRVNILGSSDFCKFYLSGRFRLQRNCLILCSNGLAHVEGQNNG